MESLTSFTTTEPFTTKAARAAGIAPWRLRSTEFRKLFRGVYVAASTPVDARVEAMAVVAVSGAKAFVSHHTAARLWGGIVPHSTRGHASVPPGSRRNSREDIKTHASSRTPTTFRGVPTTTAIATFLDMATDLDLVDLVVLGDSLVRRRRFTTEDLIRAADLATGRGSRLARRAARLVREGVDSAMESRTRMLFVLADFPELVVNHIFRGPHGEVLRRLDLAHVASRTAIEYDGRQHAESQAQWESDIARREGFDGDGWRIIILISKDIYRTPGRTLERVATILRSRGVKVGPLSDEWRRYFPQIG